jgi:uncharacterized membrane protein YkoI
MARFNAATWDPKVDSSTGHDKHRSGDFDGVVLIVGEGECPDGCGGKPNGKTRTFVQGHDARLKGICIRSGITERKIRTVTKDGESDKTGVQLASKYGFSDQVKTAIENGKAKAKLAEQKMAERVERDHEKAAAKAAKAEAKAKAKAEKDAKAAEKAAKKEAKETKAPKTENPLLDTMHQVKVGRWTYEGKVVSVDGDTATLEYTTSRGETKEATIPVADLAA